MVTSIVIFLIVRTTELNKNRLRSIYQYSNMVPRLSGQDCVDFFSFFCLSIPKRDLDTKVTTPNVEVCPEILGAILEY